MKKNILIFLLGGLFFSCISVYATIYYDASQINYKTTTLDHAIDDLYTTQNTTVTNLQSELNSYKSINAIMCATAQNGSGAYVIDSTFANKYRYFWVGSTWGSSTSYSMNLKDSNNTIVNTVKAGTKYNTSNFSKFELLSNTAGYVCATIYFSYN